MGYYKKNLYISHVSQVPEDKQEELAYYDKAFNRWLTADEIRAEEGYPPMVKTEETSTPSAKILVQKKKEKSFEDKISELEDREFNDYQKGLKKLLRGQEGEVLSAISTMSQKQSVRYLESGFEMEFSKEDLELNILEALLKAIIDSGQLTLANLGKPDLDFVLSQAVRDSVFDLTNSALKNFNESTALQIRQQLIQGLQNNEGTDQLAKRIEAVYSDAKGYRATRIARTESHRFINQGHALAYSQDGYGYVKWVANTDACHFCKALDGTITKIGTPFIPLNGSLQTDEGELINDYGDIMYADAHPNCSCRLEPATKPMQRKADNFKENELIKQEIEGLKKMKEELIEEVKAITKEAVAQESESVYGKLIEEIKNA